MGKYRKVKKYFDGRITSDGAGVKLNRIFGYHNLNDFDPFLLLDYFDSRKLEDYKKGFPWHPHRGIETVTYLIEGKMEHEDSMGNKGVIKDGDCQWMTAGNGILHQEMPKESQRMLGVQLWVNLPKKEKMIEPKYRDIKKDMVKEFKNDYISVKVIAGNYKGVEGPIKEIKNEPIFLDVSLEPKSEFVYETPKGFRFFAFVIEGECTMEDRGKDLTKEATGALYQDEGECIKVVTGRNKGRFLFIGGKSLNEPVAWGGPIVMNTQEELNQAFMELEDGTFIKKKG